MNVQNFLANNAMTVSELREALEDFSDDTRVVFSYNYGDYVRTVVAEPAEYCEQQRVVWSDYHRQLRVAYDEREEDSGIDVVVIAGVA